MRKHFIALFDAAHRKLTMLLALISIFFNVASVFVISKEFAYGILLLICGLTCLLYTLVHPWRRGRNYAVMAGLGIVIIMLIFGLSRFLDASGYSQLISKNLLFGATGLICIPCIIVGVIGSIIYGEKAPPPGINIPAK